MQFFIEKNDGTLEPVVELTAIPDTSQILIFKFGYYIGRDEKLDLEARLSCKTGKTCIVFGSELDRVLGTC